MSETNRDGGKGTSASVFRRFVREWNARNRTRAVPGPVRPVIPAVVKIPRAGDGEVKVWVKSLEGGTLTLAKDGRMHGDFLAVLRSGAFYIMSASEARRAQEDRGPNKYAVMRKSALCGRDSWEQIENAVLRG